MSERDDFLLEVYGWLYQCGEEGVTPTAVLFRQRFRQYFGG